MKETTQPSRQLELYISSAHDCDYLKGQQSQSIFISPDVTVTPGIYEYLIAVGFRRSGAYAYRPHCSTCRACISCRINVHHFKASKSQKRLLNKNKELTFSAVKAEFSEEHYELYLRYQRFKHPAGSMENFTEKDYQTFLCESFGNSLMYETRLGDTLLAISVTDIFSQALSAVYTFFDPDYSSRSLGTYSVLQQIKIAKETKKNHLYLGYYIKSSAKMSYKSKFRPIELLIEGDWRTYQKDDLLPEQSASLDSPLTF